MKNYFKTAILLFVGVFYAAGLFSQQNNFNYDNLEDDIIDDGESKSVGYAPYGEVFTPDGTLKVLVIFAGFEDDFGGDQYVNEWSNSEDQHDDSEVPLYVNQTTGDASSFLFKEERDFDDIDPENKSTSRFYYDMSYGNFKMIGDVFTDPDGIPKRINIDPTGAICWQDCNQLVLQKIDDSYPGYDWDSYLSQYDNRENWPKFQFDNTDTDTHPPDNILDYVIIVWRWSPSWDVQPVSNIEDWTGSGGGFSILGVSHDFGSYTISTGYTHTKGGGTAFSNLGTFIHEVAHELYSCPHIMGCNGCAGKKFHFPSGGWGMMSRLRYMFTANAWESWLCGWLDLTSNEEDTDLQSEADLNSNGIYTIGDFLTTGDVIRIKIPYTTDQYLWIENRQKLGVWESDPWAGRQPSLNGEVIPDSEPGIYMYIEGVQDDIYNISTGLINNPDRINEMKVLNPQGNFDYTRSTLATVIEQEYWGNPLFTYERGEANHISGVNPLYKYPDDYPNDPTQPITDGIITWENSSNHGNNEVYEIVKETNGVDTKLLFAHTCGRNDEAMDFGRRSDAFQVGDEVSLSGNVPALNNPDYHKNSTPPASNPYILNGLYVKIISYNEIDHSFQIQIKFDDYQVRDDKRWTGNIHLNNTSNDEQADVDLQSGYTINIDKSGTPNRHTQTEDYDFINLTEFHCNTDAKFVQQPNSYVEVQNESSLILHEGSTYEIMDGSQLIIKNNSVFEMEPCSRLIVHGNGQIIFEIDAIMKISEGANLVFDNIEENLIYEIGRVEIPGDYINPVLILPSNHTISETETWDDVEYYIYQDIIVEDGAIFNLIDSDLTFGNEASIVVQPGGRLIINDGKFTNTCNTFWQGITILGNPELSQQDESNQGVLEITGYPQIENSICGVHASNLVDDSQNGGILKIDGVFFKNNIIAVEIPTYHNFVFNNPEYVHPNQSYILNSTFKTNYYLANQELVPYTHVLLTDVEGVVVKNNIFKNTHPDFYSNMERGIGVRSINASFRELENYYDNLSYGIKASGVGQLNSVDISESEFTNNYRGIEIDAIDNFSIIENIFNIPTAGNGVVVLNNNATFTIEENTFDGNNSSSTTGIYLSYNNSPSNIYLNYFYNNTTGILTNNSFYLTFECNEFENNNEAIFCFGEGTLQIPNPTQGTIRMPTGNKFIGGCTGIRDFYTTTKTKYFYNIFNTDAPTCVNSNVLLFSTGYTNSCQSHQGGGGGSTVIEGLTEQISENETILVETTDGGNTEQTLETIEGSDQSEALRLRNNLLQQSPNLSDTVMVETTVREDVLPAVMLTEVLAANPQSSKSKNVQIALDNRENQLPDYFREMINTGLDTISFIEALHAEISYLKVEKARLESEKMMFFIENQDLETTSDSIVYLLESQNTRQSKEQLFAYHISKQDFENAQIIYQQMENTNANMQQIFDIQLNLSENNLSYFEMDSLQFETIEELSNDTLSRAGAIARNIITLVTGEEFHYNLYIPEIPENYDFATPPEQAELKFNLSPNPANDYFIVDYELPLFNFINGSFCMYNFGLPT